MEQREGEHMGFCEKHRSNNTPFDASLSMFGVFTTGFP